MLLNVIRIKTTQLEEHGVVCVWSDQSSRLLYNKSPRKVLCMATRRILPLAVKLIPSFVATSGESPVAYDSSTDVFPTKTGFQTANSNLVRRTTYFAITIPRHGKQRRHTGI